MDYSMQGSWDSYTSQVRNLYPYPPQARVNPPPSSQGYQTYLGEGEERPSCRQWAEQPAQSDHGPYVYRYQDDPDCLTFLRGCFAGLCCCCLLEHCCY